VIQSLLASIPSPGSATLSIGPLRLTAYGLMIALGILAAVWLAGRRLERSGAGTRDDMGSIALWGIIGGVIGARLYHVATDWGRFSDDLGRIPLIWKGGLGIPGGLLGGVIAGFIAARRRGVSRPELLTAVAPAVPLAQAIGRWGNWWNQELFGRATRLPWGLEISVDKLPPGYAPGTTFHPAFLYESLWNLALCGLLLVIDRRCSLRPGRLFAVYLAAYGIGRFWIEGLRIDAAHVIGPFRLNEWVALLTAFAAIAYLVVDRMRAGSHVPGASLTESLEPDRVDSSTE
jgi:prolipoprotein diacylglyceryl transferase